MSAWAITFSGKKFYPLDPDPEAFNLMDIAVGLSRECRFGNHSKNWLSVGEHSILMVRQLRNDGISDRNILLWALLHDAPEGLFLKDIVRPIKNVIANYVEHENKILKVVAKKFRLTWPLPDEVKAMDDAMMFREMKDNTSIEFKGKPAKTKLKFWTPDLTKHLFLSEYKTITGDTDYCKYGLV